VNANLLYFFHIEGWLTCCYAAKLAFRLRCHGAKWGGGLAQSHPERSGGRDSGGATEGSEAAVVVLTLDGSRIWNVP